MGDFNADVTKNIKSNVSLKLGNLLDKFYSDERLVVSEVLLLEGSKSDTFLMRHITQFHGLIIL